MRKTKENFNIGSSKNVVIFAGELGYSWGDYKSKNPRLMGVLDYLRTDVFYEQKHLLLVIFDEEIKGVHSHPIARYSFSNKETTFKLGLKIESSGSGFGQKTSNWKEVCCIYEKWAEGVTFPYVSVDLKSVDLKNVDCH